MLCSNATQNLHRLVQFVRSHRFKIYLHFIVGSKLCILMPEDSIHGRIT